MFSKLKSTYGRPFGVLRSAQQKTARRCEKLMTAFSGGNCENKYYKKWGSNRGLLKSCNIVYAYDSYGKR